MADSPSDEDYQEDFDDDTELEELADQRHEPDDDVPVPRQAAEPAADEDSEEPPRKKRPRRRRKPKPEPAEELGDEDEATAEESSEKTDDEPSEDAAATAEAEPEPEPEPEPPREPDHQDAVASLKDLGARLELNELGNCWRLFLYESHGDDAVGQIHGLHSLKEVWLIGTKVSKEAAAELQEKLPEAKVFH